MTGVLEQVPVEVGQQVAPGTNSRVSPTRTRLKAELRIAETQARDLTIGQLASVDTRNGIIDGKVIRIDPAAQKARSRSTSSSRRAAARRPARPERRRHG